MTDGYFYPTAEKSGADAIQDALDKAKAHGRGTVIIEGDWEIDGTLYVSDSTTLLFRGATLRAKDEEKPLITNSNRTRPRGKTLFGTQRGISIIGKGNLFGHIELSNVEDFLIKDLSFYGRGAGVILSYSTGGRLLSLDFHGVRRCILAGIGTRNCFFSNLSAEGEEESILFCSDRMPDRVVNYFGPDVKNNTVRGLLGKEPKIRGEYCFDIVCYK